MGNEERLLELLTLQKEKNKLNKSDSIEALQLLTDYLVSDNKEFKLNFITNFGPDVGIKAFVDYLSLLSAKEIIIEINELFEYDDFIKNTTYKATRRGFALVSNMIKGKFDIEIAFNLLLLTINLTMTTSKKSINNRILDLMFTEIFDNNPDTFFNFGFQNMKISDKDYNNFERLFINLAFSNHEFKEKIKPEFCLDILGWLSEYENKVCISDSEINLINGEIRTWPSIIIVAMNNNEKLNNKYGKYLKLPRSSNEVQNNSFIDDCNKVIDKTLNINGNIRNRDMNNTENKDNTEDTVIDTTRDKTKDKPEDKTWDSDSVNKNYNLISNINKKVEHIERDLYKTVSKLEYYISEYEKINIERETLRTKITEKEDLLSELYKQVEKYKIKFDESSIIINEKLALEQKYKEQVSSLISTNNSLDSNSLVEYKNKLAGKLRNDYRFFLKLKDVELTLEMSNILKPKMEELYKELIRQGINL